MTKTCGHLDFRQGRACSHNYGLVQRERMDLVGGIQGRGSSNRSARRVRCNVEGEQKQKRKESEV